MFVPKTEEDTPFNIENIIQNSSIVDIYLPRVADGNGENFILQAGMTLLVPVWIRGDRIGKHNFRFLFGYQSEVSFHYNSTRSFLFNLIIIKIFDEIGLSRNKQLSKSAVHNRRTSPTISSYQCIYKAQY